MAFSLCSRSLPAPRSHLDCDLTEKNCYKFGLIACASPIRRSAAPRRRFIWAAAATSSRPQHVPVASRGAPLPEDLRADLDPGADVEQLVRLAMHQMGKAYGGKETELVERLRYEMYDTVSAIAELREDLLPRLAHQWQMPHRLLANMHRLATRSPQPPPLPPPPSPPPPAALSSASSLPQLHSSSAAAVAAPASASTPSEAPPSPGGKRALPSPTAVGAAAAAAFQGVTATGPRLDGGPFVAPAVMASEGPLEPPPPPPATEQKAVRGPRRGMRRRGKLEAAVREPASGDSGDSDAGKSDGDGDERSSQAVMAGRRSLRGQAGTFPPAVETSTLQAGVLEGWGGEGPLGQPGRGPASGRQGPGTAGWAADGQVCLGDGNAVHSIRTFSYDSVIGNEGDDWREDAAEVVNQEGEEEEDTEEDGELLYREQGGLASGSRGATGAAGALEVDIREVPIMERRCPDKFRFGYRSGREVRLTDRRRGEPYALKADQTSPELAAELREFESFCLYGSFAGSQHGAPLRPTTFAGILQCVRQALGWLHSVQGVPLEQLRLERLVPGIHRGAAKVSHSFLMWQERERGMCKRSAARSLAAIIQLTKFLYQEQSQVTKGDKPYSDLEVVRTLRAMYMGYERATRVAGHVVDPAAKWLDWPAYLAYVGELRKECAALKANGKPRSPTEVAMSLQAYLIAAILSCVPDRQRTLRELVVGRTLVKDANGIWSIRHTHADYKTGGTYGERPPLVIDTGIYYELEEFISTWRAHLKPQHNYLFSKRDGSGPLTTAELGRSFALNAFRLTGRKVNPHMVRDMVVTYARSGHATEHELEALAVYMGHSLAEQRGTYDRRTKAQKVQPALGLLAKISSVGAGVLRVSAAASGVGGAAAVKGAVPAVVSATAATSTAMATATGVLNPSAATAAIAASPSGGDPASSLAGSKRLRRAAETKKGAGGSTGQTDGLLPDQAAPDGTRTAAARRRRSGGQGDEAPPGSP